MKRACASLSAALTMTGALSNAWGAPKIADPSGSPVTITATAAHTVIYLAHGDPGEGGPSSAFEKIGEAPVEVRLAPGVYTIEAEQASSTTAHARFDVDAGKATAIEVHNGDATVRATGSALVGLGTLAMLLGVVAIVSFGPNDSQYKRWTIGLSLLGGGAAGVGVGIGLMALGASTVHVPGQAQARGLTFDVRF